MATSLKPSMQSVLDVGNGGSAEEAQNMMPYLHFNKSSDGIREDRPEPPVPDCQSMKSDKSMHLPLHFNGVCPTFDRRSQYLKTNCSVLSSDEGGMDSQGSDGTHQRPKCDICLGRTNKSVKFCKVCKAAYCEDHVRDHYKAPGLKKHTLVDSTDDHGHVEIERTLTQVGFWKRKWILILPITLLVLGGHLYNMSPTAEGKVRLDKRIVQLGNTGSGKSSTGNTIQGREVFRAEASPVSVTTKCEKQNVVIGQYRIIMIDTPGIFGTLLQPEEVMVKTDECMNNTPHAFILVIRLEEFTDEDRKSIQWIQENFGEEALKYTIVLFTGVDQLEGKPVETFTKGNSQLLQFINSCGDRYHVFNNKDKNENTQVTELLEKIDELLNENRGYHEADLLTQASVREEEMRKREASEIEIREEEEKKREAAEREIREEEEKKREAAEREIREEEEKKREVAEREIREKEEKGAA